MTALTPGLLSSLTPHNHSPMATLITDDPGMFSRGDGCNSAQHPTDQEQRARSQSMNSILKLAEEISHLTGASRDKAENKAPVAHLSLVILLVSSCSVLYVWVSVSSCINGRKCLAQWFQTRFHSHGTLYLSKVLSGV